jgi:WD40 repeat protein
MKILFLILLFMTVTESYAAEKKSLKCEAKVLKELQLPTKGTYAFDEKENKFLATAENDVLNVFDLSTLQKIESYDVSDFYVSEVSFSPDNRFILVIPKRRGVNSIVIDRITGEKKDALARELFWLKNNQLGFIDYNSEVMAFSSIDPLSMKETKIDAPGLTKGFWYGFNSPDADLTITDYLPTSIKVYSLKEKKLTKEFHLEGIVRFFDVEKNYAVVEYNKDFSVVRLSDQKVIFTMHSELSFTATAVGNTLYLLESYGWFSTNEPDRRPYQRASVDLKTWSVTNSDYIGPWQALSVVNDDLYSLQVIDSGASRDDESRKDYYALMTNRGESILRVESPKGSFTSLDRINKSSLFAIVPSDGDVGFFNLNKPDQINYQNMGKVSFNYATYAPATAAENNIITTEYMRDDDQRTMLKLWLINQNCVPTL